MADLDDKLEQARAKAKHYGNLRGLKETADDHVKIVYAQLYDKAEGASVADRDAWVKRQPEYAEAIKIKSNRYADWTAAEVWLKLLLAEVEKYRTDRATERHMDQAHR